MSVLDRQNIVINIIAMDFTTQDLLAFCAYYTTTKNAVRLPLNNIPSSKHHNNQPIPKQIKTGRKKMEMVEPKKSQRIVKPKIEQVARKVQKKSVSPIQKVSFKQTNEVTNKKYDLDYFMSHMADQSFGQNYSQMPYRQHNYDNGVNYSKNTQNYDTFGRSGAYKKQLETFDEKVKKQNIKYTTSVMNNKPSHEPKQSYINKFAATQQLNNYSDNTWLYNNQTTKKTYINEPKKIPFVSQFSPLHQPGQSKIMNYSPSARSYSPVPSSVLSSSWIKGSPINESNLSKSRSKHQRKKSERPFYDASKLTLKAENQPLRDNRQDQSLLSQSFASINQQPLMSTNKGKNVMVDQSKRETSTTAPPRMHNKMQFKNQRQQVDLDDDLGQTLSDLQRHPPIALQVKIKSTQ